MLFFVLRHVQILFMQLYGFLPNYAMNTNALPQHYFKSPINLPMTLAGGFGEIRPNHFHSGIDIKTNEKEGYPVMASASGFVSRIKVSATGYGKAIYVTHPNGFVTVYGHLQQYNEAINKLVLATQLKNKSFEIDINLMPTQIPVQQGETIAISGNTGGSTGPHVHFEIRDAYTEATINPLLFGLEYQDSIAPKIQKILIYNYAKYFCNATSKSYDVKSLPNVIEVTDSIVNIAIEAFDFQEQTHNKMGIYKAQLLLDNKICFEYEMNQFEFKNTRYVNAFSDFLDFKNDYTCLFVKPNNNLPIYTNGNGNLVLKPNQQYQINICIQDEYKNKTNKYFKIIYKPKESSNSKMLIPACLYSDSYIYNLDLSAVLIQKNSLYFDENISCTNHLDTIIIQPEKLALQKPIIMKWKEAIQSKSLLAVENKLYGKNYILPEISHDTVYFNSYRTGNFYLVRDTIAPNIKLLYKKKLKDSWQVAVQIQDKISGIGTYNVLVNDEWMPFEYDAKSGKLFGTIPFQENLNIEIIITDRAQNSNTFKLKLI